MFPIKKADYDDIWLQVPGVYRISDPDEHDKSVVMVSCPKCGSVVDIRDYKIEPNGQVFPSFHCDGHSCSYNEHIKLKDWN